LPLKTINNKAFPYLHSVIINMPCCRRLALLTERSEMRTTLGIACGFGFYLLCVGWCLNFITKHAALGAGEKQSCMYCLPLILGWAND